MIRTKFKNNPYASVSGTCLQGYIREDFHNLVKIFGDPTDGDGYKQDAEFIIEYKDGDKTKVATIYNYKNGRNYNGDSAPKRQNIFEWNVGGHSQEAYFTIQKILTDENEW